MVWGMAAALAAGLLQDVRVLPVALFFLARSLFACRARAGETTLLCVTAFLFWGYGTVSVQRIQHLVGTFERARATQPDGMTLDGWISSYPSHGFARTSFELTTTVLGARMVVLVSGQEFFVAYGDSVRVRSRPPRSKPTNTTYLTGRGCAGSLRATPGGVERLPGHAGNPLLRSVFARLHERLRRDMTAGIGARAGVPLALLLGERGFIDRRLRDAFVALGISHLLALSGLHLGFVAGAFMLVLRWLRTRNHRLLALALLAYVATVGPLVSLLRALVMAVVLIGAAGVHRPLRPVPSLVVAFVLMLLVRPYALFAVGFQLSFLATFAVLVCVQGMRGPGRTSALGRLWHVSRSTLWVSLVVQVVLTPVILYYFGRVSVSGPVATVVFVVPVVTLLFVCAFAAIVALVHSPTGAVLFAVVDRVTEWFNAALVFAAGTMPEPAKLPVPALWVFYSGLGVLWIGRGRKWLRIVGVVMCIAAFFVGGSNVDDF